VICHPYFALNRAATPARRRTGRSVETGNDSWRYKNRAGAFVGTTPRLQYGGRFLAAALKAKDRVRVYAVNPRYDEIMGVKSVRICPATSISTGGCPARYDKRGGVRDGVEALPLGGTYAESDG
jgi:hypothetical protein